MLLVNNVYNYSLKKKREMRRERETMIKMMMD